MESWKPGVLWGAVVAVVCQLHPESDTGRSHIRMDNPANLLLGRFAAVAVVLILSQTQSGPHDRGLGFLLTQTALPIRATQDTQDKSRPAGQTHGRVVSTIYTRGRRRLLDTMAA